VGHFYTGSMNYLVFANDDDIDGSGISEFSNVRVYESAGDLTLDFNDYTVAGYSSHDGQRGLPTGYEVLDGGATLKLTGNSWKRINFTYTVTADTVIEFDFRSASQGEIHGTGLDEDNDYATGSRLFQLYGTQTWGIQNYRSYTGSDWTHYVIPVGTFYTGNMNYLVFANDDDVDGSGISEFSNVRVYESL
jgi:hypothetical protein